MSNTKIFKLASIFYKSAQDYQAMQAQAESELRSVTDFPATLMSVSMEASGNSVNYTVNADLYYPEDVEPFKQKVLALPAFQGQTVLFNVKDLGMQRQVGETGRQL